MPFLPLCHHRREPQVTRRRLRRKGMRLIFDFRRLYPFVYLYPYPLCPLVSEENLRFPVTFGCTLCLRKPKVGSPVRTRTLRLRRRTYTPSEYVHRGKESGDRETEGKITLRLRRSRTRTPKGGKVGGKQRGKG